MKQKTLFADVLETVTKYFLILVIVVVIGIFFTGIRMVKSGNVAVVLRFGELVGDTYEDQVHEPGILFAFPYIIDEVITVPTGSVVELSVTTHYTAETAASTSEGGYVITGDQNIAVIAASVKYSITDPIAYALHVKDVDALINAAVSNAMLCEAARLDVDNLLTDGKDAYARAVMMRSSEKLDMMDVGVTLAAVELTSVAMPEEVRDVYNRVNSASVQAETIIERAYQYRENILPMAKSDANLRVAQATSAKALAEAQATTNLAEFWGVVEEYEENPDVVKARIYTDKTIEFMRTIGRVYMVQDENSKIFLNPQ